MKLSTNDGATALDIASIISLWSLIVFVVNPIGDFPLVDDWSFGRTVKHLLETGEYDSQGWGYMTLLTNVLWGALFCLPTGFSFTALRISTLTASLGGLIGAYILVRDLKQPRWFAVFVMLMLVFNPVYVAMSHSFMTDVPFTALVIWSSIYFIRSLRTISNAHLLYATLLAVAATLSRQLALCIPIAFALATLFRVQASMRTMLRALIPALVCITAYLIVYQAGMIGIKVDQLVVNSLPDLQRLGKIVIHSSYSTLMHLGLFLLPIMILVTKTQWQPPLKRFFASLASGAGIMVSIVLVRLHLDDEILLPLFHNILAKSGVGPTITHDVYILRLDNMQPLPQGFWIAVTVGAMAGAVLLIGAVILRIWELVVGLRSGARGSEQAISAFALLTSLIYFLLLLPTPLYFDRYVIPMIPLLIVAMIGYPTLATNFSLDTSRALRVTAFAAISAFGLFAVAGTRDYLTWNRIRWAALEELMRDRRVSTKEIDGGFEFNGLYLYQPPFVQSTNYGSMSPWWVHRDTFRIGFGPMPGYRVLEEYTYQRWLPWRVQKVVVLRKE